MKSIVINDRRITVSGFTRSVMMCAATVLALSLTGCNNDPDIAGDADVFIGTWTGTGAYTESDGTEHPAAVLSTEMTASTWHFTAKDGSATLADEQGAYTVKALSGGSLRADFGKEGFQAVYTPGASTYAASGSGGDMNINYPDGNGNQHSYTPDESVNENTKIIIDDDGRITVYAHGYVSYSAHAQGQTKTGWRSMFDGEFVNITDNGTLTVKHSICLAISYYKDKSNKIVPGSIDIGGFIPKGGTINAVRSTTRNVFKNMINNNKTSISAYTDEYSMITTGTLEEDLWLEEEFTNGYESNVEDKIHMIYISYPKIGYGINTTYSGDHLFIGLWEAYRDWEVSYSTLEAYLKDPDNGFMSFPFDESTSYRNDVYRLNEIIGFNSGSYSCSGALVIGHGKAMPEAVITPIDRNWLPEGGESESEKGNEVTVHVKATRSDVRCEFSFFLGNVSSEPGVCNNYPLTKTTGDLDLRIKKEAHLEMNKDTEGLYAKSIDKRSECSIKVESFDYGAHGRLQVIATFYDEQDRLIGSSIAYVGTDKNKQSLTIPIDDNENNIADAWEDKYPTIKGQEPMWDEDPTPAGQRRNGDGYSLFEEYRGFKVIKGDGKHHLRTDPSVKDLFVYDINGMVDRHFGADGSTDNPAGLMLHYINTDHIIYNENASTVNERITNLNSTTGKLADQYALVVKNAEGTEDGLFGGAQGIEKVVDFENALRQVYLIELYSNSMRIAAGIDGFSGDDLIKQCVIHEIGHAIGIQHHGGGESDVIPPKEKWESPIIIPWNYGVTNCAMRYPKNSEYSSSGWIPGKHRYCRSTDNRWSQVLDGVERWLEPHNCWSQINVKME